MESKTSMSKTMKKFAANFMNCKLSAN